MYREITHLPEKQKFITEEDGLIAYVDYKLFDGGIDLTHTIVPKEIGGQGIAADLVKFALEYAIKNKLKVRPSCSYIKNYMDKHSNLYGHLEETKENRFQKD